MTDTTSASRVKDRIDFQVFSEIGIIAQLSQNRMERCLPDGMSAAQFGVLNHFARRGGEESPVSLAAAFQVTKGAMTNILQRLSAQGFVRIEPHGADGRRKRVFLTAEGRAAHERGIVSLRPYLTALREAFTDEEFATALPFLRALRVWLDEGR